MPSWAPLSQPLAVSRSPLRGPRAPFPTPPSGGASRAWGPRGPIIPPTCRPQTPGPDPPLRGERIPDRSLQLREDTAPRLSPTRPHGGLCKYSLAQDPPVTLLWVNREACSPDGSFYVPALLPQESRHTLRLFLAPAHLPAGARGLLVGGGGGDGGGWRGWGGGGVNTE